MKLFFSVDGAQGHQQLSVELDTFVIAGWAGRDVAAVEHHIQELAELGVPRPSSVPLFYRVAENQLTQAASIQALGGESSGEVEVLVFTVEGELYLSLTSDHTDRKLEATSVALAKQLCAKPVGTRAWRFADVAEGWDDLVIRSKIVENGVEVLYQEGTLKALRPPAELIGRYLGSADARLPPGTAISCGTVGAIGGIRPASTFSMELFDPRSGRSLTHAYTISTLPEIA